MSEEAERKLDDPRTEKHVARCIGVDQRETNAIVAEFHGLLRKHPSLADELAPQLDPIKACLVASCFWQTIVMKADGAYEVADVLKLSPEYLMLVETARARARELEVLG